MPFTVQLRLPVRENVIAYSLQATQITDFLVKWVEHEAKVEMETWVICVVFGRFADVATFGPRLRDENTLIFVSIFLVRSVGCDKKMRQQKQGERCGD